MAAQLSLVEARRISLAAQLIGPTRDKVASQHRIEQVLRRLALIQIDSVNVFARAHTMPLFTRLGAYDPAVAERAYRKLMYEYWGHAASMIDLDLYPALGFRRDEAHQEAWGRMKRLAQEQPGLVAAVLEEIGRRGELTARQLSLTQPKQASGWWEWSNTKTALEWLFWCGEVNVSRRNSQFERYYDLPQRVLPPAIAALPPLDRDQAHQELTSRAAQALGVATARELADYFRTGATDTKRAIAALVAAGQLLEVQVEGWREPAWLWPEAAQPRRLNASCLVSPFDNLVFERKRLRQLFGIDYSIGLYTPAAQRQYGYYVYLFLLGDRFVARVDLKADRARSALLVQSAHLEDQAAARPGAVAVAQALAAELQRAADWQSLGAIEVQDKGNLATELKRLVG